MANQAINDRLRLDLRYGSTNLPKIMVLGRNRMEYFPVFFVTILGLAVLIISNLVTLLFGVFSAKGFSSKSTFVNMILNVVGIIIVMSVPILLASIEIIFSESGPNEVQTGYLLYSSISSAVAFIVALVLRRAARNRAET